MKRDVNAFRERFKRWKSGEQVYSSGRPLEYDSGKPEEDNIAYNVNLPEVTIDGYYGRPYYKELAKQERQRQRNIAIGTLKHDVPTIPNLLKAGDAFIKSLPIVGINETDVNPNVITGVAPLPDYIPNAGDIAKFTNYLRKVNNIKPKPYNTRQLIENPSTNKTFINYIRDFIRGPQIEKDIADAYLYKKSPEYDDLVRKTIMDASSAGYNFTKDPFLPNTEYPVLRYKVLEPGTLGEYEIVRNRISIDKLQNDFSQMHNVANTGYHEALHWQRVGSPRDGAHFLDKSDPYYSTKKNIFDEVGKYTNYKIREALVKDAPYYISHGGELPVHGLEAGRHLGIKPFSEYPGYNEARLIIDDAIKYDSWLDYIKYDTPEGVKNFWKLLTGNYMPAIGVGAFGAAAAAKQQDK